MTCRRSSRACASPTRTTAGAQAATTPESRRSTRPATAGIYYGYYDGIDFVDASHGWVAGALTPTSGYAYSGSILKFTGGSSDTTGPVTYAKAANGKTGHAIKLSYRITDNVSSQATTVKLVIKNSANKVLKTLACGNQSVNVWHTVAWTPTKKGAYSYSVYAKGLAGNAQSKVGSAKSTVK